MKELVHMFVVWALVLALIVLAPAVIGMIVGGDATTAWATAIASLGCSLIYTAVNRGAPK